MSANANTSTTPSDVVKGSGQWASGTTVREIEGHFDPNNNPKNTPISKEGGVPGVDFAEKAKEKLTGHSEAKQA